METGLTRGKLRVIPGGVDGVPRIVQLHIVPGVLLAVGPVVLVVGPALNVGVGDARRVQQYLEGGGVAVAHRGGVRVVVAQNAAGGAPGVVAGPYAQGIVHVVLGHPVVQVAQLGHHVPAGRHPRDNLLYLRIKALAHPGQGGRVKALEEEGFARHRGAQTVHVVVGRGPCQLGGVHPETLRVIPEKGEDGGAVGRPLGGGEGDGGGVGAVFRQLLHLPGNGVIRLFVGVGKLAVERSVGIRRSAGRLHGWEGHQAAQHAPDQQQAEDAFKGGNVRHGSSFLAQRCHDRKRDGTGGGATRRQVFLAGPAGRRGLPPGRCPFPQEKSYSLQKKSERAHGNISSCGKNFLPGRKIRRKNAGRTKRPGTGGGLIG